MNVSLNFREQLNAIPYLVEELDHILAGIKGAFEVEHTESDSHGNITGRSLTLVRGADATGSVIADGDGIFDGSVIADADGKPMALEPDAAFGPGLRLTDGTNVSWRIEASRDSSLPQILIRDLLRVSAGDTGAIKIIRTSAGATSVYVIRPHASYIQLNLGSNASAQRINELNVLIVNTPNGLQVPSTVALANAATYDFPNGSSPRGLLSITAQEDNASAIFQIRGGTGAVLDVMDAGTGSGIDPVGLFSNAAGTAGMTNVYWNAGTGTYRIQNNRGGNRTYELVMLGGGII